MMHDAAPLVLGILGAFLSLGFAWRGYLYLTDVPSCPTLTQRAGPATEVALQRRFYAAPRLALRVGDRDLYLPASPYVLPAVHPLRSGQAARVGFCPAPAHGQTRLWELHVGERTLLDPDAWRRFARGQMRVMGTASVLSLLLAAAGLRLARRAR